MPALRTVALPGLNLLVHAIEAEEMAAGQGHLLWLQAACAAIHLSFKLLDLVLVEVYLEVFVLDVNSTGFIGLPLRFLPLLIDFGLFLLLLELIDHLVLFEFLRFELLDLLFLHFYFVRRVSALHLQLVVLSYQMLLLLLHDLFLSYEEGLNFLALI